jgi:imidazolonepropionase-like amidohydrolase
LDEEVVAKTETARERFHEAIRRAIAIGVSIAAGTDAGTSLNPIGRVVDELAEYVQLGMQIEDALLAGTVTAGRLLGIEAGVIAEGRPADLLVVRNDPRSSLEPLRHPIAVIANGRKIDLPWARATVRSLPSLGPIFSGLGDPMSSTFA